MVTMLGDELVTDPTALYAPIGIIEPICPACGALLDRFPQRQIVCPMCGQHEPPIAVDQFLDHLQAEMAKISAFRDSNARQNLGRHE